jgi:acyl-CoA synthetase (AMP-forming)/AMP-acid ligase II
MMITTSGTTGKPKAVMHGQRGMYYTALQCHQFVGEDYGTLLGFHHDGFCRVRVSPIGLWLVQCLFLDRSLH